VPDEHESAAGAWLDHPDTQREVAIIQSRFPYWSPFQHYIFALGIEMLANLNVYGGPTEILDLTTDPDKLLDMVDPDDEDEPWRPK
jgi:hypothetical protein